jgi:hypothetical protein
MVSVFTVYMAMETFGAFGAETASSTALFVVAALLVVRSVAQLVGGLRGRPVPAGGYVWIGLVGAGVSALALAIHLEGTLFRANEWYTGPYGGHRFDYRFSWPVLYAAFLAAYLLFVWPVLLRRFRTARKSAPTSPTGESCRYRARLAALGWLLLIAGVLQLAFVILTQIDSKRGAGLVLGWASYSSSPTGTQFGSRSAWLQLLVIVPQLWTAVELLGASRRRRAAATIFAACASLATILAIWDDLTHLMRLIGTSIDHPTVLLAYLHVAFPLIVPIAALVFIQHGLRREASRQADRKPELGQVG